MQTEHIRMFLAFNYSDEQLAALLAHAESGKLAWRSCCCLVGIATAPHPLRGEEPPCFSTECGHEHYDEAMKLPFAVEADTEFLHLGAFDEIRRERLIPMIHAEMERREKARAESIAAEPAQVG